MNATPRPWTIATELQQARECVAATINQDETLTIQEAREHASQALDHIEQVEEAFAAMLEALEAVAHEWERTECPLSQLGPQAPQWIQAVKAAMALAKGEQ